MIKPKTMKFYGLRDIDKIPQFNKLSNEQKTALKVVGQVLPFRTNNYVVEELIDWDKIPEDPIFQLNFLQKDMLLPEHYDVMDKALRKGADKELIEKIANDIRGELNPHPAGQMTANIPICEDGEPVPGVQHKYREIVLVFPTAGQTCHAYCTFCFRWAQFVGMEDLKFATDESNKFQKYIKQNKRVADVLFTGGDPMIMSLPKLKAYIEPLLSDDFKHVRNIRIGTKSLAYWPYKYLTDKDADDTLRFFEKIMKSGKHLSIMAHYNHWVELSTEAAQEAVRRVRNTGAQIRTQSPLIKHINDDSKIWVRMWRSQMKQGCVPYYFFVERDTGAKHYFAVPLSRAFDIYKQALMQVSGLIRTVRGPSMSALPGKVVIAGVSEIKGEKVFVLNFLQARKPQWTKQPFFAKYDTTSTWLTQLQPAFGEEKFFYQDELEEILMERTHLERQKFYESELIEEM